MSNWLQKISSNFEIANKSILFNKGMSGAKVMGKVYRCLDAIQEGGWDFPPGTFGIVIEEHPKFTIVLTLGSFGFHPFYSSSNLWEDTGQVFDGGIEEYKQLNNVGLIDLSSLLEVQQLQGMKEVTHCEVSKDFVRAIFFDPPKGPGGYENKYQIILRSDKKELITIITVANGETKNIYVDEEQFPKMLEAAVYYLRSFL